MASPQLIGSPERRTLDLNCLVDAGVQLRGRLGAYRDGSALFSGGLRNHCALADQKLGRLLDDIDGWIMIHGLDGEVGPAERFEPTRITPGTPLTLDLRRGEIGSIVWATGFHPDLSWVDLPVFDPTGRLRHDGGVVDAPGVYFLGSTFLRRRRSSFIHGAADDTRELADHLAGTSPCDRDRSRLGAHVAEDLDAAAQRQPVTDVLRGQLGRPPDELGLPDALNRFVSRSGGRESSGVGLRIRELESEGDSNRSSTSNPRSARNASPIPGRPRATMSAWCWTLSSVAQRNGASIHAPGDLPTLPHTVMATRPPVTRTRRASSMAPGVVPQMPRKLVTTSKDSSSHGSCCMSPTRTSASGLRSLATATSRGEASIPAHTAPRIVASSIARPEPQATSRTRSPSRIPRRWCTATYSRDADGSLSVEKSTTRRPHPSSTISQDTAAPPVDDREPYRLPSLSCRSA